MALAGVLAMQPQVLLADEAIAGLDPWMRAQLLGIFDELAAHGMAIILSTHDLALAQHWPDQIALMEEGRVVIVAPPAEIFSQPAWRARCGVGLTVSR